MADLESSKEDFDENENREPSVHKFTDWENEPTVMELSQDMQDAYSDTSIHIAKIDGWLDNLFVRNSAKRAASKTKSTIVPKLIRKQAEWRYSSLTEPFLSTNDVFDVNPVTAEDKKAAIQNSLVLNNQFNTVINKVDFFDNYVRTAVDEGTVIVKVGWEYKSKKVKVKKPVYKYLPARNSNAVQLSNDAIEMGNNKPEDFNKLPEHIKTSAKLSIKTGSPIEAVHIGFEDAIKTKILVDKPTLYICPYQNIIIDPTSQGDLDRASFIIYSFESSLSQLKSENKYTNLDKINVDSNSIISQPYYVNPDERSFTFNDKPRKKLLVREYWGEWDIHNNGTTEPIVATWVGSVMVGLELNPFPDRKLPFVIAQYLPVRRSLYGEPDGELLEDNQKIVGAVTRGMIDIMGRSANGQTGIRVDALDPTNKAKFKEGKDYEFNAAIDPNTAFYMHKYPEIPQSAAFMLNLQNSEAESLTGVKAFSGSQGLSGSSLGDNVGGIKSALDATAKRELGILRRLAEGVKDIGRKIISMNAVFLSEEEVIRITNDDFVKIRPDDLQGNFDLRLSISTPEADNNKAEQLAFLLQTTGQTMGPEFSQIVLSDIARLRKMPDLAKRIEEHKPTPNPIQQQKDQLELELIKAQTQRELTQAEQNKAATAFDQARIQEIASRAGETHAKNFEIISKAELNKAKIRQLGSTADLTDLNFVEQESGTTQERNLQKLSQQAEANMKLAEVKNSLKQ